MWCLSVWTPNDKIMTSDNILLFLAPPINTSFQMLLLSFNCGAMRVFWGIITPPTFLKYGNVYSSNIKGRGIDSY